jgi:hypothetical protein
VVCDRGGYEADLRPAAAVPVAAAAAPWRLVVLTDDEHVPPAITVAAAVAAVTATAAVSLTTLPQVHRPPGLCAVCTVAGGRRVHAAVILQSCTCMGPHE